MIEFSVVLTGDSERAFDLFTTRISDWWPPTHRLTKDPASVITISRDGTFRERATDGREMNLGCVRSWDRPRGITFDFYLGTGPDLPTEVVVTFEPDPNGTRVVVRHRPLPVSAAIWAGRVSRYEASWTIVLQALTVANARI